MNEPPNESLSEKLAVDEIAVGKKYETTFLNNPVRESGYRFRATHLDGRRAPKVVLSDDIRIVPGKPCLVAVTEIQKPGRNDRGAIIVELLKVLDFKLEGVYLDPVTSRKLQILLDSGLNILLDGPQGCGKTVLARSIAQALGMEFVFFNCGAVIDPADFLATIQIRASSSGSPVTDFVKTDVLIALEDALKHPSRRYLVFLDEFNRCQESARNALMPALDSTRKVYHPIDNRFIPVGDNVQFIAAVNRGSEFSATFGIDAAQLDRFAPLQMDYLPPLEEIKLLGRKHPELSKSIIQIVVAIANRLRTMQELSAGLSVRATDEVCVYLKHPLLENEQVHHLDEILKSSFCGRYNGRWNDSSSDAGMAWSVIKNALKDVSKLKIGE